MTLMIKPTGEGYFAIDDGTQLLLCCLHCLQAMDERTAIGFVERVNQGDWTLEQLIEYCEVMERVVEAAAKELTAINMTRAPTPEEIHAITAPIRACASRIQPGAGHSGWALLEGSVDKRH